MSKELFEFLSLIMTIMPEEYIKEINELVNVDEMVEDET